jgi:hypothetical protein
VQRRTRHNLIDDRRRVRLRPARLETVESEGARLPRARWPHRSLSTGCGGSPWQRRIAPLPRLTSKSTGPVATALWVTSAGRCAATVTSSTIQALGSAPNGPFEGLLGDRQTVAGMTMR